MTNTAGCRRSPMILIAFLFGLAVFLRLVAAQEVDSRESPPTGLPADAAPVHELGSEGVTVYRLEQTLWLVLDPTVAERQWAEIPRLNAPLHSLHWKDHPDHALEFVPEPQHWRLSWKSTPPFEPVIELKFDAPPMLPSEALAAPPTGDGSVMLHACQAETYGEKLRFEPQPHKNTIGYWTVPTDYALWQLNIEQTGTFVVAVLQGCGSGQGGSEALFTLRQNEQIHAELTFQTVGTGHFQNFHWIHVGTVHVSDAGRYQLRIDPKHIAHAALFDVRAIHLVRQAKGEH